MDISIHQEISNIVAKAKPGKLSNWGHFCRWFAGRIKPAGILWTLFSSTKPGDYAHFKDLGLVEHLGSGVPRILESYDRDCFKFSDNFLRMTFPAEQQVTLQVTPQVEQLISVIAGEINRQEIQDKLNLQDRMNFMNNYLKPAIEHGLIEMTIRLFLFLSCLII